MRSPSLADELLFDSLPIETQEAIKRLFCNKCEYTDEQVDEIERLAWLNGYAAGLDKR